MDRPRVFIGERIPIEVEKYIGKFCDYEKWDSNEKIPRDELLRKLRDKDGVILSSLKIDEELLDNSPKLRAVSNISVGYNNFDLNAMKKRNVIGTNTPGILDDTVADLIMGIILSAARRIPELDKYVKDGKWKIKDYENLYGVDVHHSTIGIIGMGRIGEALAKRAKLGFDAEVIYYNRNRRLDVEEKLGVRYCNFKELLGKSDFIVLMTPLTSETYHLIDFEEFSMMKKTAIFINTSRGKTINEKALIEALKNKTILGAGLDVFDIEPVEPDNELLKMSNVISLPHLGSATKKTSFDMAMLAAQNLVSALLEGKTPNIVPELRELGSDV